LPWLIRLSSVLPLAASGFAWAAALHMQDAFGHLLQLEREYNFGRGPPGYYPHIERLMASALHDALVLAWLVVVVMLVLLLASALGLWRGFLECDQTGKGQLPKRHPPQRHPPPPPTNEYEVAG
jgi:hypothetical protein